MSSLPFLSGQIQFPISKPVQNNHINNNITPVTTDVNITPVNKSIDPMPYVYDGQTTLYINSSINQTSNSVVLQYFDPVSGYPNNGIFPNVPFPNQGFNNWNFDLTPQNYLNGCITSSNLLTENTQIYDNLQANSFSPNYLGTYSLDISNSQIISDPEGYSNDTLFFSLTTQPYVCYKGIMYNGPGNIGAPTILNCNPNYSSLGTDSYLFTSQYWVQINQEIIIVECVFSVANTGSTYFSALNISSAIPTSPAPILTVTVYNKVITRDMLASIGTGNTCPKPKVYSTGVIALQYLQTGQVFISSTPCYFLFNNVPIIIADGFQKSYATMGVYYIPPSNIALGEQPILYQNNCQFLAGNSIGGDGFTIKAFTPIGDITNINVYSPGMPHFPGQTGIGILGGTSISYGHFVISVAYSYNSSQFIAGTNFTAEVLIKNIWRSPISIYSSYSAYSVNDLVNKQVVLLFGKTSTGGTFLVTNTGTPLAQITNYGITSLGNFMLTMKTLTASYNYTYTLTDYFINITLINNLNSQFGINIQAVVLQPLLDGNIVNPPSIVNCPNMWYLFLSSKNSANLSIDPTYQNVFNSDLSLYLGLNSSTLCDTGLCRYFNSELNMIGTSRETNVLGTYFGNSIYLGLNVLNGQSYYMLIILPEALFNGIPLQNSIVNQISIYANPDTVFYFMINSSTSSAFVPTYNTISSVVPNTGNTNTVNNTYSVSKITLNVSNVPLM